jgi:hypothetical protein
VRSVLGGWTTGFKILTLIAVRFTEKISQGRSRHALIQCIANIFLCHSEQRMANRLHVVLIGITLSVFYLVSFLPPKTTSIQITNPSLSIYQDLLVNYPDSVQCSCSKVAFKHQTFLTIESRFH